MIYGVIGDPHLGFKAYEGIRRTEEVSAAFETAVIMLYNAGVKTVFIPGDLTEDTVWPNWVEKRALKVFRTYPDVKFVILGGNHDSTKTYSSVSALDVLEEAANVVVMNDFAMREFTIGGLKVLAIPHMRSQTAFLDAIDEVAKRGDRYDVAMLHCMVDSKLDLGPNDLNLDPARMLALDALCVNTWIGHQHIPANPTPNVWIPGSTVELDFGELGERYVYVVKDGVPARLKIPQTRKLIRVNHVWTGIGALLDVTANLDSQTVYKFSVTGLPSAEYSAASATMESVVATFEGDMIYELIRVDHVELAISVIDTSFDLVMEFESYCADNKVDDPSLIDLLLDAITEIAAEEEDLML
jgi:DNA repair exonuclease SbcCD nuclease subunit